MAYNSESQMNLAALKRVDPYIDDILDTASQVALYLFNASKSEWVKTRIEGSFFVYSRVAEPKHGFIIMNRLSTINQIEPITKDLDFQIKPPFLLYRNAQLDIYGIWFYEPDKCARIGKLIGNIILDKMEKSTFSQKANKVDILTMLSEAHGKYHEQVVSNSGKKGRSNECVKSSPVSLLHKPHPIKVSVDSQSNQHSTNLLEDLFQFSKSRDSAIQSDEGNKTNGLKSLVQKLAQNGGNASPNNLPLHHSLSFNENNGNMMEGFLPLDVLEKNFNKKLNVHMSEPNLLPKSPSAMSRGIHEQPSCVTPPRLEQSNSLVLMSPMVFSSSRKDKNESDNLSVDLSKELLNSNSKTCHTQCLAAASSNGIDTSEITPLTKTQLIQAISYLLKSDPEFVHTIHDAYIKSIKELTSRKT